ncbi:MAG: ACP S-malonyltransferase [Eubacteriales bacterium]|nr:ACP S-malonyltransferase [Eubacteriales bacterium]
MSKTAYMFPGQGAQYIGMGRDFYEALENSRRVYEISSQVTGLDIAGLCFEENENINITEYTQIALYTTEMAMYQYLLDKNLNADVHIGLSLGEYAALTASKVISLKDGCHVVRKRGMFMEHEVMAGIGTMAAVLGMTADKIESVLEKLGSEKEIAVANYNCPGQIVISGEKKAVINAMESLKEAGAKRVIELNVSGPFHSPMLLGAGSKLAEELEKVVLNTPEIPYVANVNADYVNESTSMEQIKKLLAEQVYSSVRFEQSVRRLIADGVTEFVEIGPGKTLTGFVKKIAKDMETAGEITTVNIEKMEDAISYAAERGK